MRASTHPPSLYSICCVAVLCCAAILSTPVHTAQAQPKRAVSKTAFAPIAQRAQTLLRDLQNTRGSILGLGPTLALTRLLPDLPIDTSRTLLQEALRRRPHPHAAALLEYERAKLTLQQSDRAAAKNIIQNQGFVTSWMLLGPFANEGLRAFDQPLSPEIHPLQAHSGRHGATRWVPAVDRDFLGTLDAESLIRPIDQSAVYAVTVLRSPKRQNATLSLTTSGPFALWLQGGLIATDRDALGGAFDREALPVQLSKGDNILLLKVGADPNAALSFSLRTLTPAAKPLPLQAVATPKALKEALPRNPPQDQPIFSSDKPAPAPFEALPPLRVLIEAARKLPDAPAQRKAHALVSAALYAQHTRPNDPAQPHLELLRQALKLAPKDPHVLDIAADIYPEAWQQLDALKNALQASPQDPWLHTRYAARLFQSQGDHGRFLALRAVRQVLSKHPTYLPAQTLEIQLLLDEGLFETALTKAKTLSTQHPNTTRPLKLAVEAISSLPTRAHDALPLSQKLLALDSSSIPLYGSIASMQLQAGQPQEALKTARKAYAIRPDITGFLGLIADIQRAAGQPEKAQNTLSTLTELVPGDSSYWTRLGVLQAELNQRERSNTSLQRALSLQPQNIQLKDYLDRVNPKAPSLDESFAVSPPKASHSALVSKYPKHDTVTLLENHVTQVFPNGLTATFVQRSSIALTDRGAEALRTLSIPYTPGSESIDILSARVTRADGSTSETWQSFEQSMSEPWYNLYYDLRSFILFFGELKPGDTVDVKYRVTQTTSNNILGSYFGDVWYAQDTSPRLDSRYTLILPSERDVQIRAPKLPHKHSTRSVDTPDGTRTAHLFQLTNVPGIHVEDASPGFSELADYIHISTYATWEDLGAWYWNLIKGQLVVDSQIAQVVDSVTKGIATRRNKVRAIHNWVVQNTRYVGLEFGIHGFKPYRTTQAFQRRFGDCKDKASLIKVMLQHAGIDANIVLIRTRSNGAIDTLPASLEIFDHAISYVPEFDLFLDGTAEYSGIEELPFGDQGVQVLIVADGGKVTLTQTPVLKPQRNTSTTHLDVSVKQTNTPASVSAKTTATGSFAAHLRQAYQTPSKRTQLFTEELSSSFSGSSLASVSFSNLSKLEQPVQLNYTFSSPNIISTTSKNTVRIFPTLRTSNLTALRAPRTKRTQPLEVGQPETTTQHTTVTLPSQYTFQTPKNTTLSSPFGRFSLSFTPQPNSPNSLKLTVQLTLSSDRVAPTDYKAFRAWLEAVDRTLNTPITATQNP